MNTIITRPVWAEINLDNLAYNIREVRRVTPSGVLITAVIKADGYGHGAAMIGQTLLENGADRFAVAMLSEGLQLRKAFPETEILILGYTPEELAGEAVENRLTQTVFSKEQAQAVSRNAQAMNRTAKIHIKLDTGMGRIGMQTTESTVSEILEISEMSGIEIEGMFTHFAVADETDKQFTHEQVKKYRWVQEQLENRGVRIPICHVSNSAGIIDLPDYHFNMVRAGIVLYGLYPSDEVSHTGVSLKEVMTLKARVSHVKELEAGRGVSYGLKYRTEQCEKIATLPLGYADGYTRMLSGKAHVMIQGQRVPVVGRICMDQCMIRVTGLDVKPGDEVVLFGGNDSSGVSIDEVAAWLGTINYEIICMIDKRVPRVYMKDNAIVAVRDYVREL